MVPLFRESLSYGAQRRLIVSAEDGKRHQPRVFKLPNGNKLVYEVKTSLALLNARERPHFVCVADQAAEAIAATYCASGRKDELTNRAGAAIVLKRSYQKFHRSRGSRWKVMKTPFVRCIGASLSVCPGCSGGYENGRRRPQPGNKDSRVATISGRTRTLLLWCFTCWNLLLQHPMPCFIFPGLEKGIFQRRKGRSPGGCSPSGGRT